jgi:hypothetical protein
VGKSIGALASYFQPVALELLERCRAAGIPCAVIQTDRTIAAEQTAITTGHAWVKNPADSKHTPQPPEMKSEAIDICPEVLLSEPNWDPDSPLWDEIGSIGTGLGLFWGGRWTHINEGYGDRPHFELVHRSTDVVET